MSAPVIAQIADAVLATIQGATLSQAVTVERLYLPEHKLPDFTGLLITVVPKTKTSEVYDRSENKDEHQIDVGVRQKLTDRTNDEIDGKLLVVEEIADLFIRQRLAAYPAAACMKIENVPIVADEHLNELNQFTSLLTLTFRLLR